MSVLVFLVILAAVAAVAYFSYRAKQRRREELATFALQQGLEYSPPDPFGLLGYDFHLFQLGDGRGCENVLWGNWRGMPVKEADFWYYTESSDGKGSRSRKYHHFSVAIAELTCFLPQVTVEKEDVGSWLTGHLGFHDIQFESEQFNRMFNVRARDREFAFKLLDARMIRWLLSTAGRFGFEVNGQSLLVWSARRKPSELVPLLGCARLFCDHVPRLVVTEYGIAPARPEDAAPTEERSTS